MLKLLIDNYAKDDQDNDGQTALMIAAERGFEKIVEYLIEMKVDVNVKNKYGKTALMMAKNKECKKLIENYINNTKN